MDNTKCKALKNELARQPEPWIVPVERFFDGNDDLSSFGWDLPEHPGMDAFRNLLTGLLRRPDVQAVYAHVTELDLGEDCWPAAERIFIAGTISPAELQKILIPLEPVEVCAVEHIVPPVIKQKHRGPFVAASW